MNKVRVATFDELDVKKPTHALVGPVDLVIVRWPDADEVSVLYGRCLHRGALLSDGEAARRGPDLRTARLGLPVPHRRLRLQQRRGAPQVRPLDRGRRRLRRRGRGRAMGARPSAALRSRRLPGRLRRSPRHTRKSRTRSGSTRWPSTGSRDVGSPRARRGDGRAPRASLPSWDDIQILTAQLHRVPLLDDEAVGTELVIGPRAAKPLRLEIPLFVSDMSFGALSEEAKIALAKGAEAGGHRDLLGRGRHAARGAGREQPLLLRAGVGALRLRDGAAAQGAGLPLQGRAGREDGHRRASAGPQGDGQDRRRCAGSRRATPAISPARFPDWEHVDDFRRFADEVRECTGGIPIGFKLSAQHVERDSTPRSSAGADYVILDGRGGGTGAAPLVFRNNISVPTIPALARARRHLDAAGRRDVTLIITGGLRVPSDFVKALALGADGDRALELGHPGDRLPRHARLPHQQLPGRHRHPEAGPARAPRGRPRRQAPRALPRERGRAHAGAGASLRPSAPAASSRSRTSRPGSARCTT